MEIRFNIEFTEREQEKFNELCYKSDRTHNQLTKALIYGLLNKGFVTITGLGEVRGFEVEKEADHGS
jgi:hypothetical protein